MNKKITILGSTGSIGTQTLDVIRQALPSFDVVALSGGKNIELLAQQVHQFKPKMVCVTTDADAERLISLIHDAIDIHVGSHGLLTLARESGADVLVNALVGKVGLLPTLAAIDAGMDIALANKETLVTAGNLVMDAARQKNIRITPIDSEHSAIWQCLQGNTPHHIKKIILTASGGPFRTWTRDQIKAAKASDALKHPNWAMGSKITIDSATMMNKGLEFIEAMWLFDTKPDDIDILVHPQSIIHSMVEYVDGSVMAQMGLPDMRLPIMYALTGPSREAANFSQLDLLKTAALTFEAPDEERFPCLALAKHAARVGGTLPAVMNYVNEWAVSMYLADKITFYEINRYIEQAFNVYTPKSVNCSGDITEAEGWAAAFVKEIEC